MNDQQVIFSMVRVNRVFPPNNKQVIRDISFGFYYGAKIGVLGLNGSGKSTLLRIIAGLDQDYSGEVTFSKGYSVGLLEQEPHLDDNKTVKAVVEEAVTPILEKMRKYDEINNKFAEPDADFDALIAEQSRLQENSITLMPGLWITAWKWPWKPCAARPVKHRSTSSQVANDAVWH